jgi:hypothetical protein
MDRQPIRASTAYVDNSEGWEGAPCFLMYFGNAHSTVRALVRRLLISVELGRVALRMATVGID